MSVEAIASILLIGSFAVLVMLKVPIAFSIAASACLTTFYLGMPLQIVVQNSLSGINKYSLMAVPFFILAGEIMSAGGISNRLIVLANALVGWIRGGLAMVNCVASTFFGGISGSSVADVASIGPILIPMMRSQGYDGEFATDITLTSSIQGLLIPPSHNMVVYAMVAGGLSLPSMFMAGIVPGVLLGIVLMVYAYICSVKRNYPKGDPFSVKNLLKAIRTSIWGLGTVLIVVVGVITGVFTATESAAIAVVYAMIITFFVYREIKLREFWKILGSAIRTMSIVMITIGVSSAFGWLLAYLKFPELISRAILGLTSNPYLIMLIINVALLFLGAIMDLTPIILIATPVLLPIVTESVGLDPVHFGIVMIFNLGIGLLTPPVGSTLFVGSAISGIGIERIAKSLVPFYLIMVAMLMAITFFPPLVMTLPNLVGG